MNKYVDFCTSLFVRLFVNEIFLVIDFNNKDVELFIEDVFVPRKMSISSQRQLISAIKLFKAFYPECKIEEIKLTGQKKSKILPTVLSKEQIIDLLPLIVK